MKTALFTGIAIEEFGVRDFKDRRKRVNRLVCSFVDVNNIEYRRAFIFPTDFSFDKMLKAIPTSITIN